MRLCDKFHSGRKKQVKGFTLAELLLAVSILAFVLTGLLLTFISCLTLNETTKNLTFAINSAQDRLEEIRDYTFSQIHNDYNGHTFEIPEIPGNSRGVVEVDNSNPDLLKITVIVCWRQKGKVIGGDENLNPLSTSPAKLVTLMASR